ncbi:multi-sensor hybrid histidine kinase [hydrothermal vent metagenome]|uniref:Multi-sensor hybrid histidine kinase n=1 Tax=hydrothermal vent metagenome TaxID=652676 RepID=A0A1W1BQP5_9ZZZZ
MAIDIKEILNYSSSLTILYVEDDPTVRGHTVELLEDFFQKVLVAEDGAEGLQKYLSYKKIFGDYPDIVITDIRMPNIDGLEMSEKILEVRPHQTIIVLSAHNDNEYLLKLINLGINYFLSKPFRSKQIFQALYGASKKVYNEKIEIENRQKLEDALREVELANRAKDNFFANISHELRTPMNAIMGFSHILLESQLDKKQYDYLNKIKLSGDILLNTINDILDFSKIESGDIELEYIEFSINTILDNISKEIKTRVDDKGLDLSFNVDKNIPNLIKGDPLRLTQVIRNLVDNAVKFTDSGEVALHVKLIHIEEKKELLRFEVVDTGIGLTDDQIGVLFKPFVKIDDTTGGKIGGSGLGLVICKKLVQLMGGTIRVESRYGIGSRFIFEIDAGLSNERSYHLPSQSLMTKRVLIVDSDVESSSKLGDILKYFQYTVFCASNIEDANILIKENSFDIIFIDKMIMTLCKREIVQRTPSVKIVMMDNRTDDVKNKIFNDIYISSILKKPFSQQMIFDMILELYKDNLNLIQNLDMVTKNDILVLQGSRILLVEDNIINQTVVLGLLEDTGIEVIVANNGKEALEQLAIYDDIEMILMDINMPIMDGYEATTHIRNSDRYDNIPIIALTANDAQRDISKAKELGMQEHMTKPIDISKLYNNLIKYIKPKISAYDVDKTITKQRVQDIPKREKKLKELNTDEGIIRTGGSVELYKNVLFDFINMFRNSPEKLERLIELREFDKASKLLHNVKGTAGNIGATNLFNIIVLFESALKNSDDNFEILLDSYKDTFKHVVNSIDIFIEKEKSTLQDRDLITNTKLSELLAEIYLQAKKRRALVCKKLALELESYEWPDEYSSQLNTITNSLKQYQFKSAIKAIEEIL